MNRPAQVISINCPDGRAALAAALARAGFLLQTEGNGPYDLEQARILANVEKQLTNPKGE